ncbi:MAG: hypothetical protein IJ632_00620 [Muribaculaceae bacterium]|nr:hypothetical protein [Muribaculaceae bacterium]
MKKVFFLLFSSLALMATACSGGNTGSNTATTATTATADKHSESYIRQRVTKMQGIYDTRLIFSPEFYEVEHRAAILPDFMEGYSGFDWCGKVLDVCDPEKAKVRIVDVKVPDATHANVEMTYFDPGCYSIRYKVHLLFVDNEWMIDDVTWLNNDDYGLQGSERDLAQQYINETALTIANQEPGELMNNLKDLAPNWQYDSEDFFYRNPQAVNDMIDGIQMVKNIYQAGAYYTPEIGVQIDKLVERIRTEARQHGVKL